MSHFRDIDEYTEAQLRAELERRASLRERGLCDYCGQAQSAKPCRFPDRHRAAAPRPEDNRSECFCGTPAGDLPVVSDDGLDGQDWRSCSECGWCTPIGPTSTKSKKGACARR